MVVSSDFSAPIATHRMATVIPAAAQEAVSISALRVLRRRKSRFSDHHHSATDDFDEVVACMFWIIVGFHSQGLRVSILPIVLLRAVK